ncbi:TPA: transporter substrate-binding domain-containing protein [Pseudomonas aeruginosa]
MNLKILCLFAVSILCWELALAASYPPIPQELSSQLHIHHHDLAVSPEEWQWLRHKAELRVGVIATESAPFSVHQEAHLYEGINADVTALIAELLGLRVTIVPFANEYDATLALQAGSIDVFPSNDENESRGDVIYSIAYASVPLALFRSSEQMHSPLSSDFSKIRIAVSGIHRSKLEKRYPQANFKMYADHDQAMAAAAFGHTDAYLGDLYSGFYRVNRSFYGLVRFEQFSDLPRVQHRYALRADNFRLSRLFNAAISSIGSEKLREVAKRWIGNSFLPRETLMGLTAEETRWMRRHPVVKLVINDDLAPGAYLNSKKVFSGGVADVLELITLTTGLRFEVVIRSGGLSQIMESVQKGQADMALMTATPERERYLRFSRPLISSPFVLLSRIDEKEKLGEMVGKRIAVPTGHLAIGSLSKLYPEAVVFEAGSSLDAMNLLYQRKIDAALVSLPAARYYIERLFHGKLAISQVPDVGPITLNFAMRRSDAELQSILDKVLRSIAPDELNAISNRWRSPPGMSSQTWVDYEQKINRIVLGAALLLVLTLVWVIYLYRSIKARLKAELMLSDQLQFVETLIDTMPLALYVRDLDGRMAACNRSYLEAVGLNAEQVLNRTVNELPGESFKNLPDFHESYLQAMQMGQTIETEHLVTLQGKDLWIEHWVQPFRDSKGRVKGVICGWVDITEHRRLVQQLQDAKFQADEASRAKTSFLATMSHEIRTPMNAVVGILELALKRSDVQPIDKASIQTAHTAATSLLELIGDILDIARIESGRLSLSPRRANIRDLVESVARVFEGLARQKRLNLVLDIDSSINCDVLIDAMRFKQIFSNLISNAIKFTDRGAIRVSIFGYQEDESSLRVSLIVEDTGVGISMADQKRLFKPFAQVDRNVQKAEGAGLGLVICRSLCEMMGGRIFLNSTLGQGTRVCVEVRFQILEKLDDPQVLHLEQIKPRARLQILVVDDHSINRQVLREQLEFLGHDVYEAENGQVAYQLWIGQPFDVVITDCHMPVMNGIDLARDIRRAEQALGQKSTVVIGLTADAQQEEIEQCTQAGMNICLIKPLGLDDLDAHLLALQPDAPLVRLDVGGSTPITPAEEKTYLDLSSLEALFGSGSSNIQKIIEEFFDSNRKDCQILWDLLAKGDREYLADRVHRINGAAKVFKADLLVESCQKLETVLDDLQASHDDVREAVRQVEAAMEALEQFFYSRRRR